MAATRKKAASRPRRPDTEIDKAAKSGYKEGYRKGRELSKPKRPAKPSGLFDESPVNSMTPKARAAHAKAFTKGVRDAKGSKVKVKKPKSDTWRRDFERGVSERARQAFYGGRGGSAERLRGK